MPRMCLRTVVQTCCTSEWNSPPNKDRVDTNTSNAWNAKRAHIEGREAFCWAISGSTRRRQRCCIDPALASRVFRRHCRLLAAPSSRKSARWTRGYYSLRPGYRCGVCPKSVPELSQRNGAPGGIRTHDPLLRRQVLYPAELQARFLRTFCLVTVLFEQQRVGRTKPLEMLLSTAFGGKYSIQLSYRRTVDAHAGQGRQRGGWAV